MEQKKKAYLKKNFCVISVFVFNTAMSKTSVYNRLGKVLLNSTGHSIQQLSWGKFFKRAWTVMPGPVIFSSEESKAKSVSWTEA